MIHCAYNNQNNFDANGNLLNLNNTGNLEWHYNNTLNKLTKANKSNTIQYYGLVWGLRVVFAAFAEDVGADVQGATLLFCLVG
jgi:hypothetical protein